jgi:hypothetical protein
MVDLEEEVVDLPEDEDAGERRRESGGRERPS